MNIPALGEVKNITCESILLKNQTGTVFDLMSPL